MKFPARPIAFAALLSLSPLAGASTLLDLSLEELLDVEIFTAASKMSQKPAETPATVRVLTAQDIRNYGWRTLGEALNNIPGVSVVTDRNYEYLSSRGAAQHGDYSIRYLLTIDGVPVNCAVLESASVGDAFPLDISLIERIEYVPGAGSVAYGANAMLGTINISTNSARGKNSSVVDTYFDSVGRRQVRGTLTKALDNGGALTLSGTGFEQLGRDQLYGDAKGVLMRADGAPTPDGVAHQLDRSKQKKVYAKLENDGFNLSLFASDRSNHPSTAPHYSLFDDQGMQVDDKSFNINANFTKDISSDLIFFGSLVYMGNQNTITLPYLSPLPPYPRYLYTQDSRANRWFGEARINTVNNDVHQISTGVDFSVETSNKLSGTDNYGNIYYANNAPDSKIGVYLLDQWRISETLQLHPGIRGDYSKRWGGHVSPRLGLTWQYSPTLTFKAIASEAFRNPNPIESRGGAEPGPSITQQSIGNPGLSAEKVKTRELVAEWQPNKNLEFAASLYQHDLSNIIEYTITEAYNFQYQNLSKVDATGIDFYARYKSDSKWKVSGSISLQKAKYGDGTPAVNSPQWKSKIGIDGPLWGSKTIGALEIQAQGKTEQNWNGLLSKNPIILTTNLTLTADNWLPKIGVQLRINNLFNRKNTTPGSVNTPQAAMPLYGRSISIGVSYAF